MKKFFIPALAIVLLTSFHSIAQTTWTLDPAHAHLGFSVSHMMLSDVDGSFKSFTATIHSPKADFSDAKVEMSGDIASVNTDNEKRDEHLKSADFFDAAKFPKLTFVSRSFVKKDANNYKVTGDLTLHGITKTVVLDAVCRTGVNPMNKKTVAGFKISGKIKRSDFDLAAKMPSAMLGEEVEIIANAEFIQG